jgi:tellurium resistance protein TerZ
MAIELKKGGRINLTKAAKRMTNVCLGINWGAVERRILFGLVRDTQPVDLDASIAVYDKNGKMTSIVCFDNLRSRDDAIMHSGDDRIGDEEGNDGRDNEIIQVNFDLIENRAQKLILFLNSYEKHDFERIPFADVRIYEGTPNRPTNVLATYNLTTSEEYAGKKSMILGAFEKQDNGEWNFEAMAFPLDVYRINDTLKLIDEYLL